MTEAKEIFDEFLWTKENKVITRDRHQVPGLSNFSHWNFKSATEPAPIHYHSDLFEIHCMMHGRRIFQVQQDQMRTFIITGHQASMIFPGQLHGYQDGFLEPYEFYSMQIRISDPDHLLGLDPSYSRALCRDLRLIQDKMTQEKEQRLKLGATHLQQVASAFTLFSYFDADATRMGVQLLSSFLHGLRYLNTVSEETEIDGHVAEAIRYMRDHYMDNPPLQAVADHVGYSLSYFKLKFREEIGITPAYYLAILRIEHAKEKLRESNCSITKLASDLNFSSSSHFCAVFKKQTSYTPREYRERHS